MGIKLNPAKSRAKLFGSKKNLLLASEMILPLIVIDGQIAPLIVGLKNLGVLLAPDLSWSDLVPHYA